MPPRYIQARLPGGDKIRPRKIEIRKSPKGSKPLSQLPGYDNGLRSRSLRILLDEDADVMGRPEFLDSKLNIKRAKDLGLKGKPDRDIARAARNKNRILITFNHGDFFPDRDIKLKDSPGLIAIKGGNNQNEKYAVMAEVIERILIQIGQNVKKEWWKGVKILISGTEFTLKKDMGGKIFKCKIKSDSRGVLWFKELKVTRREAAKARG